MTRRYCGQYEPLAPIMSSQPAPPSDPKALDDQLLGGLIHRRGSSALVRGEGCWVWDDGDRRYLDMTSGHGVACLGHAHPAVTAAVAEQAGRLMACSAAFYNDQRRLCAAKLVDVLASDLGHVFFANSGTEATEAGIKFARLASGRSGLVALKGGFHGRSLGALSVTWNPQARKPFEELLSPATFVGRNDTQGLESAIGDDTAVVVVEVIQGESGVHVLAPEFLHRAQELCRARGALFMIDEIQTGIGRTGRWFAHQALELSPDLLTLAKSLAAGFPIGAVCFNRRVRDALVAGSHGTTFGGNPLATRVARATLETLVAHDLPARAEERGRLLLTRLRQSLSHRRVVREIRGRGLMVGIELRERVGPYLKALMEEHSVLALNAGPTVLRVLPPLIIDEEQIEEAAAAIAEVLPE